MYTSGQIASILDSFSNLIDFNRNAFRNFEDWNYIYDAIERLNLPTIPPPNGHFIKLSEDSPHPYNYFNPKILDLIVSDLYELTFPNFYPQVILDLYNRGMIDAPCISQLYYLVNREADILHHLDKSGKKVYRIYLNYFYGAISHRFNIDPSSVPLTANRILTVLEQTVETPVFGQADTLYFLSNHKNIKEVENAVSSLNLQYKITHPLCGYFFNKDKFLIFDTVIHKKRLKYYHKL